MAATFSENQTLSNAILLAVLKSFLPLPSLGMASTASNMAGTIRLLSPEAAIHFLRSTWSISPA